MEKWILIGFAFLLCAQAKGQVWELRSDTIALYSEQRPFPWEREKRKVALSTLGFNQVDVFYLLDYLESNGPPHSKYELLAVNGMTRDKLEFLYRFYFFRRKRAPFKKGNNIDALSVHLMSYLSTNPFRKSIVEGGNGTGIRSINRLSIKSSNHELRLRLQHDPIGDLSYWGSFSLHLNRGNKYGLPSFYIGQFDQSFGYHLLSQQQTRGLELFRSYGRIAGNRIRPSIGFVQSATKFGMASSGRINSLNCFAWHAIAANKSVTSIFQKEHNTSIQILVQDHANWESGFMLGKELRKSTISAAVALPHSSRKPTIAFSYFLIDKGYQIGGDIIQRSNQSHEHFHQISFHKDDRSLQFLVHGELSGKLLLRNSVSILYRRPLFGKELSLFIEERRIWVDKRMDPFEESFRLGCAVKSKRSKPWRLEYLFTGVGLNQQHNVRIRRSQELQDILLKSELQMVQSGVAWGYFTSIDLIYPMHKNRLIIGMSIFSTDLSLYDYQYGLRYRMDIQQLRGKGEQFYLILNHQFKYGFTAEMKLSHIHYFDRDEISGSFPSSNPWRSLIEFQLIYKPSINFAPKLPIVG